MIDVEGREIRVASAGHLPPLLISDGEAEFVTAAVGLPIGVEGDASYASIAVTAPPNATLLAFTDGLVEHRGEHLDDSLERLRRGAVARDLRLPDLLSTLIHELQSDAATDDIAIVGLRWMD
jgi:serine phosphatase RsbU (regulator of sigma subunit)